MSRSGDALSRIKPQRWCGLSPSIIAGRFHLTAVCVECGEERVWTTRTVFDPDTAVGRVHQAGWSTGKKVKCPDCSRGSKKENAVATKPAQVVDIQKAAPLSIKKPDQDAKKARLEALDWLRESFNPNTGRFAAGISDATIAKEVGLSPDAVATLRDEWFGPLGEPDELADMRGRLDQATATCDSVLSDFLARVEAARLEFGPKIAAAKEEVARISAEFDRTAVRNGWKR